MRPPLYLIANDLTYATNVTIEEFSVWTESGDIVVNKINNVFGIGDDSYGPNDGISSLSPGETPHTYTSTYTITASPTNWVAPTFPTWAAPSTGYGSMFFPLSLSAVNLTWTLTAASPIPVYTPAALWRPGGVDYDLHYWGTF